MFFRCPLPVVVSLHVTKDKIQNITWNNISVQLGTQIYLFVNI